MAMNKTRFPLDALRHNIETDSLLDLLPEIFYGPDCTFAAAVAAEGANTQLIPRLAEIETQLSGQVPSFESRWPLLSHIAHYRAGDFNLKGTLDALRALPLDGPDLLQPWKEEIEPLKDLANKYFPRLRDSQWEAPHWQFLDLAAEKHNVKVPHAVRERTPILVANEKKGRVLILVVERQPGPAGLITPDWWKLGLLPFSSDKAFVRSVHTGFEEVIRHWPGKRYRFRWWLEKHPKSDWPDVLDEGDSIQVAAACAALALFEDDSCRPLLDEISAVSAKFSEQETPAATPGERRITSIGCAPEKTKAAIFAELVGVIFAANQEDIKTDHPGIVVEKVPNLADAYDSLLITSKAIRAYKQEIVWDWEGGKDENGEPLRDKKDPAKIRGEWKEEETHQDFKNGGNNS